MTDEQPRRVDDAQSSRSDDGNDDSRRVVDSHRFLYPQAERDGAGGYTTSTMSANTNGTDAAFEDVLDARTKGRAKRGPDAERKATLANCAAPLSTLAAAGVEVPWREFDPEAADEYPTTQHFAGVEPHDGGVRVHLHQNVREIDNDAFGDFGTTGADDEEVIWTVVDLTGGTVTLTVVGDWGKRREVPFTEFPHDYEPLTLADGQPQWGY